MAPRQKRTIPTGYHYIKELATGLITPYPGLSWFFDDCFDTMSTEEKGKLMSYGKNSTHQVVHKQEYDDADFLPETESSTIDV